MEYKYNYTMEDEVYNQNALKYSNQFGRIKRSLLITMFVITIVFSLAIALSIIKERKLWEILLLFGLYILLMMMQLFKYLLVMKACNYLKRPLSQARDEIITIKLTENEIVESDEYENLVEYAYENIIEIIIDRKYIDVLVNNMAPLVIPVRIFKDDNELEDFLSLIQSKSNAPITRLD